MGYPVGILETHSSDAVCKLWNSGWKRANLETPGVLNPTRADEHCPRRWFLLPLSPRASSSCEPLYLRALVSSEIERDPRLWNRSNHYTDEPRPSLSWICSREDLFTGELYCRRTQHRPIIWVGYVLPPCR
ncbi:hypothetical protein RHGRI_014209 [Rhododendron griersonianum]|uniref:Uncharacterized protein n=1 Tax=Rhododendron griersonianum TaxID=479676 RepID=A0AAV6K8U1_9ERIC|nr:hypothetical protein RHGRI_014209 [Rhododendron griersonianum]